MNNKMENGSGPITSQDRFTRWDLKCVWFFRNVCECLPQFYNCNNFIHQLQHHSCRFAVDTQWCIAVLFLQMSLWAQNIMFLKRGPKYRSTKKWKNKNTHPQKGLSPICVAFRTHNSLQDLHNKQSRYRPHHHHQVLSNFTLKPWKVFFFCTVWGLCLKILKQERHSNPYHFWKNCRQTTEPREKQMSQNPNICCDD